MPRKTPDELYSEATGKKTPDDLFIEATSGGKGKVRAIDMPPKRVGLAGGLRRALTGQTEPLLGLGSPPQDFAVQPNIPPEEAERMNREAFQEAPRETSDMASLLGKQGQVERPGVVGEILNPFEAAALGGAGAIHAARFGQVDYLMSQDLQLKE
jgi:hypothetical protein